MGEEVKRLVVGLRTGQVNVDLFCGQFKKLVERRVSLTHGNLFAQLSNLRQAIDIYAAVRPSMPNNEIVEVIGKELFIICARVLLSVPFLCAPKHLELTYFRSSVTKAEAMLRDEGHSHRFAMLKWLMEFNWRHPVLQALITGRDISNKLAMHYITKAEFPEVFRLRVEMLLEEGDHDLALNLCLWCSEDSLLALDPFIRASELILLFNRGYKDVFFERCRAIHSCTAVEILQSVDPDARSNKGYLTMAQCFLIQEWLRPCVKCAHRIHRYCCTKALLELWLEAEYLQEPSIDEFQLTISHVVQKASSTFQLMVLVDTLNSMFGSVLLGTMLTICHDTLQYNRQLLEQTIMESEMESERIMGTLAYICITLARITCDWSGRMRLNALLSAITLEPREDVLFALMTDRHGKRDGLTTNVLVAANSNNVESTSKMGMIPITGGEKTPETNLMQLYRENGVLMLPGGVAYDVVLDTVRSLEMLRLPSLNPNQSCQKLLSNCMDHLRESEVSLTINIPQENILLGSLQIGAFDPLDLLYKKAVVASLPSLGHQTAHIPPHASSKDSLNSPAPPRATSQLTTTKNVSQPSVMPPTHGFVPITSHPSTKGHFVSLPSPTVQMQRPRAVLPSSSANLYPPRPTESSSFSPHPLPPKVTPTSNTYLASELAKPLTATLPNSLKKQSYQMINRLPDHLLEAINNAPIAVNDKMTLLQQSDPQAVVRLLQQMLQKEKPAMIDLTDEVDTESDEEPVRPGAAVAATVSSLVRSASRTMSGEASHWPFGNVVSSSSASVVARGPGASAADVPLPAAHGTPNITISRPSVQVPCTIAYNPVAQVVSDYLKPSTSNSPAMGKHGETKTSLHNTDAVVLSSLHGGVALNLQSPTKSMPTTVVPVVTLPKTMAVAPQVSPSLAAVVTTTPNIALSLPHILPSKDIVLSSPKPLSGTSVTSSGTRLPPFPSTAKTLTVFSDRSQNALSQCRPVGSIMNTTLPQPNKSHSVSSQKSKVHLTPSRLEAALKQQQQQQHGIPSPQIGVTTSKTSPTKISPKRAFGQTDSTVIHKSPRTSSMSGVVQPVPGIFMPTCMNQMVLQQSQSVIPTGHLSAQTVIGGQTVFDGQQMLSGHLGGQNILGAQNLFGGQTLVGNEGLIAGQNLFIQGHDGVLYQTPSSVGMIASQRGVVLQQPGVVLPQPQQSVIFQNPGDLHSAGALHQVLVASDDGTNNIVFLQCPQIIQSPQLPQLGQIAGQAAALGQMMQPNPQMGQVTQASHLASHLGQVIHTPQVALPASPAVGQVIHSPQLGQIAPSPQLCLMQSPQAEQLAPSPQLTQLPPSPCRVIQSPQIGQILQTTQLNQVMQTPQLAGAQVSQILAPNQRQISHSPAAVSHIVRSSTQKSKPQNVQPEQIEAANLIPGSSKGQGDSLPKSMKNQDITKQANEQRPPAVSEAVQIASNVCSEVVESDDVITQREIVSQDPVTVVLESVPATADVMSAEPTAENQVSDPQGEKLDVLASESTDRLTEQELETPEAEQSFLQTCEDHPVQSDALEVQESSDNSRDTETTEAVIVQEDVSGTAADHPVSADTNDDKELLEDSVTNDTVADAMHPVTDEMHSTNDAGTDAPFARSDSVADAVHATNDTVAEAISTTNNAATDVHSTNDTVTNVICTTNDAVTDTIPVNDFPAESTDDDDTLPASPSPDPVADGDSTQDGSDATICITPIHESIDVAVRMESEVCQPSPSDSASNMSELKPNSPSRSQESNAQMDVVPEPGLESDIGQPVSDSIGDINSGVEPTTLAETIAPETPQLSADVVVADIGAPEQALSTEVAMPEITASPAVSYQMPTVSDEVSLGMIVLPQEVDEGTSAMLPEPMMGDSAKQFEQEVSGDITSSQTFVGEETEGQDLLVGLSEEASQLPELGGQLNLQDTELPMTADMTVNEGGQNPEEDFNKISQHVQKQVEEMLKNVPSDGEEHDENKNLEDDDLEALPLDQEAQEELVESEGAGDLDLEDVLSTNDDVVLPTTLQDIPDDQKNPVVEDVSPHNAEMTTDVAEVCDPSSGAIVDLAEDTTVADAATVPDAAANADEVEESDELVEQVECSDVSIQCDMPEDNAAVDVPNLTDPIQTEVETVAAGDSSENAENATVTETNDAQTCNVDVEEELELKESDQSNDTMEADSDVEISFKDSSLLKLQSAWPETPTDEEPDPLSTNEDASESPEAKESPLQEEGRQRLRRSTRTKVSYEEFPLHLPPLMKLPKKDSEVNEEKKGAKVTRARKSRSSSADKKDVVLKKKARSASETHDVETPTDHKEKTPKATTDPPQKKLAEPKVSTTNVSRQMPQVELKEEKTGRHDAGSKQVKNEQNVTPTSLEQQPVVIKEEHRSTPSPQSMPLSRNPVRLPRLPRDQLLGQTQAPTPSPMTSSEKRKEMSLISQEAIARVQANISQDDDMNKFQDSLIKALEEGIARRNFVERPQMQVSKDLNSLTILLFFEPGQDPLRLIVKTKMGSSQQAKTTADKVAKVSPSAVNRPQVYKRVVPPSGVGALGHASSSPNNISNNSPGASPMSQIKAIPATISSKSMPEKVAATHPCSMMVKRVPVLISAPRASTNSPIPGKISPKARIIVNTVKKVPPKRDVLNNNKPGEEKIAENLGKPNNEGPAAKRQKVLVEAASQERQQLIVENEVKPRVASKSPPCAAKPWHNIKDLRTKKPISQPQSPRSRPMFTVRTVKSPKTTSPTDNLVTSQVRAQDVKASTPTIVHAVAANTPKFEKEYEKWIEQQSVSNAHHAGYRRPQPSPSVATVATVSNTSVISKPVGTGAKAPESTYYLMSYQNWFKGKTYNSTKTIKANNQKSLLQRESPPAAAKSRVSPAEEAFLKIVQKDREVSKTPASTSDITLVSGNMNETDARQTNEVKSTKESEKGKAPIVVNEQSQKAQEPASIDSVSHSVKNSVGASNSPKMDQNTKQDSSNSGAPPTKDQKSAVDSPATVARKMPMTRSSRDSSTEPDNKKRCLRDSSVEPRRSQERSVSPAVRSTRSRHPSTSSTDSGSRETRSKKSRLSEPELSLRSRALDTRNTRSSTAKSPALSSAGKRQQTVESVSASMRRSSSVTRRQSAPSKRS